jgi:hypothetical protein
VLDEDLREALRDAVVRRLREPGDESRVRDALRAISRAARARGLRAEHVVIALKSVCDTLPEMQGAVTSSQRARVLDRLVTLCIEEYYAEDA